MEGKSNWCQAKRYGICSVFVDTKSRFSDSVSSGEHEIMSNLDCNFKNVVYFGVLNPKQAKWNLFEQQKIIKPFHLTYDDEWQQLSFWKLGRKSRSAKCFVFLFKITFASEWALVKFQIEVRVRVKHFMYNTMFSCILHKKTFKNIGCIKIQNFF